MKVSSSQLDEMIRLLEKLRISIAATRPVPATERSSEEGRAEKTSAAAERLDLLAKLERAIWSVQLASLRSIGPQFVEMAARTAEQLGKTVDCETRGLDLDVPGPLLDLVSLLVLHGVRNGLDHGIETPDERKQAGKPENGKLRLSAQAQCGSLVVRLADDGRGVDLKALVNRAVERSLLRSEQAQRMTDAERLDLVFRPGFSSKPTAGVISGRGIGLDSVRAQARQLGGEVTAHTGPSGGFVLNLVVPLSALALDVVPVVVGRQTFCFRSADVRLVECAEDAEGASDGSREAREQGLALAEALGQELSPEPKLLRVAGATRAVFLAADLIGAAETRVFRRLDEAYRPRGATDSARWLDRLFEICHGSVLASPVALGAEGVSGFALLADERQLAQLAPALDASRAKTPEQLV